MEDLLDFEDQQRPRKLFSVLGFVCAIITPLLMSFTYFSMIQLIQAANSNFETLKTSIKFTALFSVLGFFFSSLSLIRKEHLRIMKPAGIALNTLWLIVVIGFIYYFKLL